MKLQILLSALVLAGTAATAQNPEDLRIYINPGHGSWTGNDRPVQVIGKEEYTSTGTDTTGFFESNTDLIKGFGVLEKLIEMGVPFDRTLNQTGERWEIGAAKDMAQNICMSHVKNGPYEEKNTTSSDNYTLYNRNLSEICVEVEENEFDIFISIHSNAANSIGDLVIYHLYMYRGKNGRENEAVKGSYAFAEASMKYAFANEHACWSEDHVYINGDVDFMGHGSGSTSALGYYGWLGVLKHGTPGYLVEGFFHTYLPATHRAMNFDVDLIEGYQYARGIAEYFEFEKRDETGEIYGIVRDAHTTFAHALYISRPNTDDVLKPLNGCKVYLWKDGKKIKEYTTDQYYNGAFVFIGLEPGMYQLTFEHPDYEPGNPVDVEVKQGLTVYPKVFLTDIFYHGKPGEEMNYANPLPEDITLGESYEMISAYTDRPIAQLEGKTPERLIYNKGHLFVLARDAEGTATVLCLDPTTGDVLADVNLNGCEGTIRNVGDIQVTGQGDLVACSMSKNQHLDKYVEAGDVRGTVNFYTWDKNDEGVPTGAPKLWFSTQSSGTMARSKVGGTFVMRGNLDDGQIALSAVNVLKKEEIRFVIFDVVDGVATEKEYCIPKELSGKDFANSEFKFVLSPNNRHQLFISGNSTNFGLRQYDFLHELNMPYSACTSQPLSNNTTGLGFFKYGGNIVMTASAPAEASTTVKVYDITRSIGSATELAITHDALPTQANTVLTTGYPLAVTDAGGNVTGGDFCLVILRDNKISRYASSVNAGIDGVTVDVDQDAPAIYYDLSGRRVDNATQPGVYICLKGTKATKIYVK